MDCSWFTVCVCIYLSITVNCQEPGSQEIELQDKNDRDNDQDKAVEDAQLEDGNDQYKAVEDAQLEDGNDQYKAAEDAQLEDGNDQFKAVDDATQDGDIDQAGENTRQDDVNDQEVGENTRLDDGNDQDKAFDNARLDNTENQDIAGGDTRLDGGNDQGTAVDYEKLDNTEDQVKAVDVAIKDNEDTRLDNTNNQEAIVETLPDDAKDQDKIYEDINSDGENPDNAEQLNNQKLKDPADSALEDDLGTRELEEILAGHPSDLFPSNPHRKIPEHYTDFSRRFVLQYPYNDGNAEKVEEVEDALEKAVKIFQSKNDRIKVNLTPVKASPELVLAVARQSQLVKPKPSQNDELLVKAGLRTGEYWNALWKEDVNPDILRTSQDTKFSLPQLENENSYLRSIKVQLDPKAKLFDLMSILKEHSPRLLYVINTNRNKQ